MSLVLLESMGINGVEVLDPPLLASPAYLFLHKKHAALAPRLDAALRAMKADGSYQRIRDATLRHCGIE